MKEFVFQVNDTENLVKLLEAAAADNQLMQQLQSMSSYEEVKSLAREQGFDLGDLGEEEAARTIGVATGEINEELSDEELEMVAGGFVYGKVTWTWDSPKELPKGVAASGGDSGI